MSFSIEGGLWYRVAIFSETDRDLILTEFADSLAASGAEGITSSVRGQVSHVPGVYVMAFVVTEPCFGCKYTDCVVVCP